MSWLSGGADSCSRSIYTTTYSASYSRPQTTWAMSRSVDQAQPTKTGFAANNRVSPLDLAPMSDTSIYNTTSAHATHSDASSVKSLAASKPIARASMEHSGFWTEPQANVLYDSPARRVAVDKERATNASYLDSLTLKRMKHHNPIDAENGGAGPRWGSTTASQSFQRHETSHERFNQIDRSLIGKKEHNGFTRQHIAISEERIDDGLSTTKATYTKPVRSNFGEIPSRTVMEHSGFATAAIPTMTRKAMLSDTSASELHPIAVTRLKHKNTPEYQNLFDPDPYKSIAHVSYTAPNKQARAATAFPCVRRGATGYNSNESVIAGPPGDRRTYKTGKTETMKKFKDPETLRPRATGQVPNVVERSGYWAT